MSNLAWTFRLLQFDRISLRVVQAGEPAVGIRLRVNLDLDSCRPKLGGHSVEIPDSKVHHPVLVGIPEMVARLRERSESGGSCLLLPRGFPVARGCERDPQVLLVPMRQRGRIVSSKEQSSDSCHFFHFRSSCEPIPNRCPRKGRREHGLFGCLRRNAALAPA